MCLFKITKVEDEDDYVAVRERRKYRRRTDRIRSPRHSAVIVPTEPISVIPPPQPVPLLPRPKPLIIAPPPPSSDVHYVHVSPRSSEDSARRDEYVYERREVRYERDRSPDRYHEYRYVDAPEPEYPRERRRHRSRSRRRDDDRYDDYDEDVRVRVRRTEYD